MDRKIIKLPSRYGIHNELRQLTPVNEGLESKTYLLKSEADIIRTGYTFEDKMWIDPSGGPMITEGQVIVVEEESMIIKKIDHLAGQGYVITFE